MFSRAVLFFILIAIVLRPGPSETRPLERLDTIYGVNRVNLGWLPEMKRQETLSNIVEAHVSSVRLTLAPPFADSILAVRAAQHLGLGVLLNINLSYANFYPPGILARPGANGLNEARKLSQLDPEFFLKMFTPIWRELEADGIPLTGIELGNEINWADFNGDLSANATSSYSGALASLPEREAYEEGMRRYVQIVRIVSNLRNTSIVDGRMKIISAGLATIPEDFAAQKHAHYVAPSDAINLLRSYGIDEIVSGYGLHFYPGSTVSSLELHKVMYDVTGFCGNGPNRIPCWLTEWGVASHSKRCPSDDLHQAEVIAKVRDEIEQLAAARRVSGSFYFDWDGLNSPYSIWRCGALTEGAARAFLQSLK